MACFPPLRAAPAGPDAQAHCVHQRSPHSAGGAAHCGAARPAGHLQLVASGAGKGGRAHRALAGRGRLPPAWAHQINCRCSCCFCTAQHPCCCPSTACGRRAWAARSSRWAAATCRPTEGALWGASAALVMFYFWEAAALGVTCWGGSAGREADSPWPPHAGQVAAVGCMSRVGPRRRAMYRSPPRVPGLAGAHR